MTSQRVAAGLIVMGFALNVACARTAAPTAKRATPSASASSNTNKAQVSADAATLQDFKARIDKYMAIHKQATKGSLPIQQTSEPAKITAGQESLAAHIRAARGDARPGDIFTLEIRNKIRRLFAPELKGKEGVDTKAAMEDDAPAPGQIPFRVNATYPLTETLPTVPANVLAILPPLPAQLEYRVVGKHLILRDVPANIIVDYMLNVMP